MIHMKEDHGGMFCSQRPVPDGINPAIDPFQQPQGPGRTDYLSEWPATGPRLLKEALIKRSRPATVTSALTFAACC